MCDMRRKTKEYGAKEIGPKRHWQFGKQPLGKHGAALQADRARVRPPLAPADRREGRGERERGYPAPSGRNLLEAAVGTAPDLPGVRRGSRRMAVQRGRDPVLRRV